MTTTALSDHVVIPSNASGYPRQRVLQWGVLRPLWSRVLRVSLLAKLLGANLILAATAIVAHEVSPSTSIALQLGVPLAVSFVVTGLLVWLALRPIAELEATAERVSRGDFTARVPASSLADRDILRLSATINRVLSRVETDRARIQYLAGRSVRARDIERESVARELRDSFAQMVSAIALQVAAAQRINTDADVEQQLERSRSLIAELTDEMRGVAEALYPGTLGEFGLMNALHALARRTERQSRGKIAIAGGATDGPVLSTQVASALYRVADEALRNIVQHADAKHTQMSLRSDDREVTLEIEDDGRGVDLRTRDPMQAGLGLFSAKAVLALIGGTLQISSASGLGTHVVARVPVIPKRP